MIKQINECINDKRILCDAATMHSKMIKISSQSCIYLTKSRVQRIPMGDMVSRSLIQYLICHI